jgi:pimeloyl-ACP methyl ester carboxylesterase
VLDSGPVARWTLELHHGRLTFRSGSNGKPDLVVRASADILTDVVDGRRSGLRCFLDGDLTVRGDLSLALALDGMFAVDETPDQWPHADLVDVRVGRQTLHTAHLEAGPADAPAVVLLHGLGATNASMLPVMWDLAADHRVFSPDLPGFGASDKPRASYTPRYFSRWLTGYLDALGLDRVVLVGNSMGGRIAIEQGHATPERVRAMVLLCPSPAFRRLRQWVPLVRLLRPELASLPLFPPAHRFVVDAIRAMFSQSDRLPQPWYDAAADEFQRVFSTRGGRVAFFACARQIYLEQAVGKRGFWDRLPDLQPPALFLWGDRDRLVPSGFARHVERALPQATSIVLTDSGHVPQFEHPPEVSELVRAFLTQHP